MNTRRNPHRPGFSSIDLLVIIAAVVVAGLVLLPIMAKSRARLRSGTVSCANNLKQIWITFHVWAGDHGDKMPMQVSTNLGGTMELVKSGAVFPHFAVMSNELATPKVLRCWWDLNRHSATNFATLRDSNISYFIVPEAREGLPGTWLLGDRNLATNGVPLKPGLFRMPTDPELNWTTDLHDKKGYLCYADGHVAPSDDFGGRHFRYTNEFPLTVRLTDSATNALRAYREATTDTSFRLAIP